MKQITIKIYGQVFRFQAADTTAERFLAAVRGHRAQLDAIDRAKMSSGIPTK
jgi:hypothetical protein